MKKRYYQFTQGELTTTLRAADPVGEKPRPKKSARAIKNALSWHCKRRLHYNCFRLNCACSCHDFNLKEFTGKRNRK